MTDMTKAAFDERRKRNKEILRLRLECGMTLKELGKKFGLNATTIRDIVKKEPRIQRRVAMQDRLEVFLGGRPKGFLMAKTHAWTPEMQEKELKSERFWR
jgi:hypothetical protein